MRGTRLFARAGLSIWACAVGAACDWPGQRTASAGLYFEDVSFAAQVLGGSLEPQHLATIESVARAELVRAFSGLRIVVSDRRDARYRVAVVQQLRDERFRAETFVAGASRAVRGFGGQGAVNFSLLASAAVSCAPARSSLEAIVEAIGRGVGRSAAHELAHQLLPTAAIHDSQDIASYEYAYAGRCQQYFGPMHWDIAGPMLRRRLGP
jgi:hypothetical protein